MAAAMLFCAACQGGHSGPPPIGEAYVGPVSLKIRSDIPLESSTAATVRHGDRLEILQRRRRFLRVRTPSGAVGWTDERQLLSTDDMDALKDLSDRAHKLPSQGVATCYGELNVHTLPLRQAPSFLQIHETEKVDVVGQVVFPRVDYDRKPLIPPPPKKAKVPKKPPKEAKVPPPPMPPPPKLPANWLDLSKSPVEADPAPPVEQKPIPTDEWSLIRTKSGQAGWVLTGRLYMAIPDEVAQYAEGHRIVAYFPLGQVEDGDQKKNIWLWTTTTGQTPVDFQSFRVFIWSLKRHRYETAYIERNLQGYLPVLLSNVEYGTPGKGKGQTATAQYPGFSVCVQKDDGKRYRREYALLGNIVRFAGEKPCEPPPPLPLPAIGPQTDAESKQAVAAAPVEPPAETTKQKLEKWKQKVQGALPKWLGGKKAQ